MHMRQQELQNWCNEYFKREVVLEALSGDASFRRYFRIRQGQLSWIVADAPPQTEKNAEFVHIAQLLNDNHILSPQVLAYDALKGFLLLSDLGDQTLLPLLNANNVDDYYRQSMQLICAMQQINATSLAPYNKARLDEEMGLFAQWFVVQLLGYQPEHTERELMAALFEQLSTSALAQPQVFVHRDFHSRNIMVVNQRVATIDFQDAVCGAISYDVVSLLRDCYIAWPQAQVDTWLEFYYRLCLEQQLVSSDVYFVQFKQWFDWMGLQRHLKVLGIFARLSIRDTKHGYLHDLPLVIQYTRQVLAMYPQQPQFCAFLRWFDAKLVPLIQRQHWSIECALQ